MEPDVSIESECMIRIAVIPIGPIPQPQLRDYVSMLVRHRKVDLSAISSFYTEHQKSPFAHQPWDNGSLRFKFMLGGSPPSPWEDFQPNRKILAVIGLCHCPSSPDLDLVSDQFSVACKGYTSALVKFCFAFCPGDSQVSGLLPSLRGSNVRQREVTWVSIASHVLSSAVFSFPTVWVGPTMVTNVVDDSRSMLGTFGGWLVGGLVEGSSGSVPGWRNLFEHTGALGMMGHLLAL
ncbi:hypothetical protein HHK36_013862 [Tetracentron sinense]|uniref:Trs120/TRAPPC9 N-terminal domain-containing protein n=1 Tax=Tetracentron sinense TaxID=13715 RepID=A0A835DDQ8_TETSI|nr:hypothetical protein HHK36_033468 [Tetracentron sinense]KAF8400563.1 hypothetical protein HHK36_013862 [Tetracentron sinense]